MTTRTARQIVEGALRLINVVGRGMPMSAEDGADGLEALNDMLSIWSTNDLLIPVVTEEEFTLTVNISSYTIGTGKTFNTVAPMEICDAKMKDANGNTYKMTIANLQRWNRINDHTVTGRPYLLYYLLDAEDSGTIKLYFTPNAAETLVLFSTKPLTEYTNLSDNTVFPEGYNLPLKYNLAIILADEHGKTPRATIVTKAEEFKNRIEIQNLELDELEVDPGLQARGKPYNINTG